MQVPQLNLGIICWRSIWSKRTWRGLATAARPHGSPGSKSVRKISLSLLPLVFVRFEKCPGDSTVVPGAVQLITPEIVAGKIMIGLLIGIALQVSEVVAQDVSGVVFARE